MNKFIVNSKVLLTALQYVSKVIENRPAVPIIENFLFDIRNQVLTVSGTNLQSTFTLSWRIECQAETVFQAVVPKEIIKYIQKMDESPLQIEWDPESYSVLLYELGTEFTKGIGYNITGRAKYSGENPVDFPRARQTDIALFETNSDMYLEFKDLLNYVSADELRPAMTGIGFLQYLGAFNMVATDGHTLKAVNVPELNAPCNMTAQQLQEYQKHMQTKIEKYESMDVPFADKQAEKLKALLKITEDQVSQQHFILPAKPAAILASLKFGSTKKPERAGVTICTNIEKHNISFLFSLDCYDMELTTKVIDERYPQYWNVIPETSTTKYTTEKRRS